MNEAKLAEIIDKTTKFIYEKYGSTVESGYVIGKLNSWLNENDKFVREEPIFDVNEIAHDASQFVLSKTGYTLEGFYLVGRLSTLISSEHKDVWTK